MSCYRCVGERRDASMTHRTGRKVLFISAPSARSGDSFADHRVNAEQTTTPANKLRAFR